MFLKVLLLAVALSFVVGDEEPHHDHHDEDPHHDDHDEEPHHDDHDEDPHHDDHDDDPHHDHPCDDPHHDHDHSCKELHLDDHCKALLQPSENQQLDAGTWIVHAGTSYSVMDVDSMRFHVRDTGNDKKKKLHREDKAGGKCSVKPGCLTETENGIIIKIKTEPYRLQHNATFLHTLQENVFASVSKTEYLDSGMGCRMNIVLVANTEEVSEENKEYFKAQAECVGYCANEVRFLDPSDPCEKDKLKEEDDTDE